MKGGWFVGVETIREKSLEKLKSIQVENFQGAFLQRQRRLEKCIFARRETVEGDIVF